MEYNAATEGLKFPSRTGQIQVTIPSTYDTEEMYYTEQTTERNPSLHGKLPGSPGINTEEAVISFSYDGGTQFINALLQNSNPTYDVNIRGEYKTIAKI